MSDGFPVHVHQTNSQLISDLHLSLPHQLTDATKGKPTHTLTGKTYYVASVGEMSYLAIYILISLLSPQNFIAIIPLVMYVSGFVCSMAMKPVSKLIGISVSLYLIRYWQQQPLVL